MDLGRSGRQSHDPGEAVTVVNTSQLPGVQILITWPGATIRPTVVSPRSSPQSFFQCHGNSQRSLNERLQIEDYTYFLATLSLSLMLVVEEGPVVRLRLCHTPSDKRTLQTIPDGSISFVNYVELVKKARRCLWTRPFCGQQDTDALLFRRAWTKGCYRPPWF